MVLRVMSVNGWDLYGSRGEAAQQRYAGLEALIRHRDPDIIAVQEIISAGTDHAGKRAGAVAGLHRLAETLDRRCEVTGEPALAVGGSIHHPGLLWRDGIEPVPGTLHPLTREGAGMWHGAVAVVLDVGGPRIRVGSVQLSPFDQVWARMDASQLLRIFNDHTPGFLGGDFNGVGSSTDYDPDPYDGVPWHPDHAYQLDEHGELDRQAAIRLEHPRLGRMRDCARLVDAPWTATTGFHPKDHHPDRRIDRWYATHPVPAHAVTECRVASLEDVRLDTDSWLTDHRPVEIALQQDTL